MPSVYDLKPKFQALLRPLIAGLAKAGFTANSVTLLAVVGSIGFGVPLAFARERPLLLLILPGWLFARMALNAIDGMMARELGMKSNLGAVLNEVGDVLSDLGLYLPLAFVDPTRSLWPVVAFSFGAALTEFCGVLSQALGGARQYQGPMGKSDRALVVGAVGTFTAFFPAQLLPYWPWVFGVAAALTVLTCLNRCRTALRQLPAKPGAAA